MPPRVLLEPVIVTTLRAPVTQARPAPYFRMLYHVQHATGACFERIKRGIDGDSGAYDAGTPQVH